MAKINYDLKSAIEAGKNIKTNNLQKLKEKEDFDEKQKQEEYNNKVIKFKEQLESSDFLYTNVTRAVSEGNNSFSFSQSKEFAKAVSLISGFSATYKSGYDNINSDEIKEFWEEVTVKWYDQLSLIKVEKTP